MPTSSSMQRKDPNSGTTGPPQPRLVPATLNLGTIIKGQPCTVRFRAECPGGPWTHIETTVDPSSPWLQVSRRGADFPFTVELKVDTNQLQPGEHYPVTIALAVDGVTATSVLDFHLGSRAPGAAMPARGSPQKQPSTDQNRGLLPWPPPRWQRTAIWAGVPLGVGLALVSGSLGGLAYGLGLVAVAAYVLAATKGLYQVQNIPLATRIAGVAVMGHSLFVAALVGLGLLIAIVLAVFYMIFIVMAIRLAFDSFFNSRGRGRG